MSSAGRFAALLFLGTLLAQAAWILAVPPFNAIDEIDHVYRASGVASGEWRLTEVAREGRGLVTSVSEDLVAAGSAQCHSLDYMERDNCTPITRDADRADMASAAGAYHPAFYAVVGAAGLPFEGVAADYAMRGLAALVCALGTAFAGWCLVAAGAGVWTRLCLVITLTPGLLYTTIVPAPNGVEIVAGLCLWASLLSASRVVPGSRQASLLLTAGIASAVVLATPRVLGPLWVLLIVALTAVFVGWRGIVSIWQHHVRLVLVGSVLVASAAGAGAWWTLTADLTDASSGLTAGGGVEDLELGAQPVVWLLQVVGAFPFRGEPAPTATYAIYMVLVVGLIAAGLRCAGRARHRLAIAGAVTLAATLPIVLTYLTAAEQGVMWQGRYGLPLIAGILPMCGLVLDRDEAGAPERRRLVVVTCLVMLAVAHAWSVWQVADREIARGVYDAATWVTLPVWALGGLTAVAVAVMGRAILAGLHTGAGVPTEEIHGDPATVRSVPGASEPQVSQSRPSENADSRSWRE